MNVRRHNLSHEQAAILGHVFQALLNRWPEGIARIMFNTAWSAWLDTTADPDETAREILELLYESRPDLRDQPPEPVLVFRLPR